MAPPAHSPRPRRPRRRFEASILPILHFLAVLILVAASVGSWLQFTERQATHSASGTPLGASSSLCA